MAKSAIQIPDYVTVVERVPDLTVRELAESAAALLSVSADLPAPRCFDVSQASQRIALQFGPDSSSFRALAEWADRYGGTLTGEPGTDDNGTTYVRCEVKFDVGRVQVKAYAYIEAETAAS